jgi:ABC-type nitrate/sulfonate/bicarbonate transport system ATPase subunit
MHTERRDVAPVERTGATSTGRPGAAPTERPGATPTERPGATPTKIHIERVRKGFPTAKGRLEVIQDLNFEVQDGEFVAIVGPSGCGKTTLMNIIAGFLAPDSGAVKIDGTPRAAPNRKGVLITQQGAVFPWLTVKQNLLFGLPDELPNREQLAHEYAELVGLNGFENNYPHELSGGMLKRCEIARALVVKPEVLYMDEPFSALDALMSLRMQNELLRILAKEKHTVLLITHDVEEAIHLADRVLVLSARPARIQAEFKVNLAHPRKVSSPEAQALRVAILKELGVSETV